MKPIIILKTNQTNDYWYESREVHYPRLMSYDFLKEASDNLPVPGIGLYVDRHRDGRLEKLSHLEPALLRITNIRKDESGKTHIKVELVARVREVRSSDLDRLLGADRWITAVSRNVWSQAQRELSIRPPRDWSHMLEVSEARPICHKFLGSRYLALLELDVDYVKIQEVVADVMTAIGFDVTRLSHIEKNETNPDGFACTPPGERFGYWFIYNCKSTPFHLPPEAVFRTKSYLARYKKELPTLKAVPAASARFMFVAPGFEAESETERNLAEIERKTGARGCLITLEALLLVMTRRLQLGYRFTLGDFDKLFMLTNIVDAGAVESTFRL